MKKIILLSTTIMIGWVTGFLMSWWLFRGQYYEREEVFHMRKAVRGEDKSQT